MAEIATFNFSKCELIKQKTKAGDSYATGKIFFGLSFKERNYPLIANVKQVVGSEFAPQNIEVETPPDLPESIPYDKFREMELCQELSAN